MIQPILRPSLPRIIHPKTNHQCFICFSYMPHQNILLNLFALNVSKYFNKNYLGDDRTSANRTEETLLTEETSSSGIASKNTSSQNRTATSSSSGGPLQSTPPGIFKYKYSCCCSVVERMPHNRRGHGFYAYPLSKISLNRSHPGSTLLSFH